MKKDIQIFKKNHSEMKNIIPEMNNILEGIKSSLDEA